MIQLLTLVALLAVAWSLARLVRRMDDLRIQMSLAEQEDAIQHSITRRFVGVSLIEGEILPLLKQKQPIPARSCSNQRKVRGKSL
jgi:hypothetical protein